MLKRIYIHNFRCFQNFELKTHDLHSALFLGRNGAGKSTLIHFFDFLRKIGEGDIHLSNLLNRRDFNFIQPYAPMRFEIEVEINQNLMTYGLVIEFPENFKYPKIQEESLYCNQVCIIQRKDGQVSYYPHHDDENKALNFLVDWHMIALQVIQTRSDLDIISIFKDWLSKIVVLSPIPALMKGESQEGCFKPDLQVKNLADWATGLFGTSPKTYISIFSFLENIFPDLEEIKNQKTSERGHKLSFIFKSAQQVSPPLDFESLSYGERIFVMTALLIASVETGHISLCVWDEPDNYISLVEIENYFFDLRRAFRNKAQLLMTTHNPEAIRTFSTETTFILRRESHLEPTRINLLSEIYDDNDVDTVEAIKAGLIEL